jgi:hypothetical protein
MLAVQGEGVDGGVAVTVTGPPRPPDEGGVGVAVTVTGPPRPPDEGGVVVAGTVAGPARLPDVGSGVDPDVGRGGTESPPSA